MTNGPSGWTRSGSASSQDEGSASGSGNATGGGQGGWTRSGAGKPAGSPASGGWTRPSSSPTPSDDSSASPTPSGSGWSRPVSSAPSDGSTGNTPDTHGPSSSGPSSTKPSPETTGAATAAFEPVAPISVASGGVGMLGSLSPIILLQVFQPGNPRIHITPTMMAIGVLGAVIAYLVVYLAMRYLSRIATSGAERLVCALITALMACGAVMFASSSIVVLMEGQLHTIPLTPAHFLTPRYQLLPLIPLAWAYAVFSMLAFLAAAWLAATAERPTTGRGARIALYVIAVAVVVLGCAVMPAARLGAIFRL